MVAFCLWVILQQATIFKIDLEAAPFFKQKTPQGATCKGLNLKAKPFESGFKIRRLE